MEFPDQKEILNDDGVGIDLGIKDLLSVCSDAVKYKNTISQKVKETRKTETQITA